MKDMGIIQGSAAQAVPLIVGKDRVDVHTDIIPVTQDNAGNPIEGSFQYREIQYAKDEYLTIMAEKNSTLETQLNDTQLALVEIYESLGGVMNGKSIC